MKLSIKTLAMAIALAAILALGTACDDDKGDSPDDPPAGGVAGPRDSGNVNEESGTDETEITAASRAFEYSDENIVNPERGFHGWISITDALDAGEDYLEFRQKGLSLAFANIKFDKVDSNAFRDKPLNSAFLQGLSDFFGRVRKAGLKLVVRFCYGDVAEDAPLARILEHIGQLKPVLQENADVIAVLQAGFIGYWGEWHHTKNGVKNDTYGLDNTSSRAAVLDALLDALPKGVSLQVRKPSYKTDYLDTKEPLSADIAHNGEAVSRLGHHNDCFLASDTDKGTYPSSQIEFWKDYIEHDGDFVPVGGETCEVNPPRSGCETAVLEMKRLHWSFINLEYHEDVIAGWEDAGCLPDIRKNIGYRFVLENASWNKSVPPSGILTLKATIKNLGYAAPFNERPVYAVLTGFGCYKAKLTADPRFWGADSKNEISVNIKLPSEIDNGSYELSLWLPDPNAALQGDPRYSIQFANAGTWDETNGLNILTDSLLIDKTAPKSGLTPDASFEPCE